MDAIKANPELRMLLLRKYRFDAREAIKTLHTFGERVVWRNSLDKVGRELRLWAEAYGEDPEQQE